IRLAEASTMERSMNKPRWLRHFVMLFLIVTPFLFIVSLLMGADHREVAAVAPQRGAAGAHPPPRVLPNSCAPAVGVTPVVTHVSSNGPATPTPLPGSAARDQEQLACTGGLSVRGSPTQTLTVGVGGQLVRVDLALCSPAKNARIDVAAS